MYRTRALTDQVVLGNHDDDATNLLDLRYFNKLRALRPCGLPLD